CCSLLGTPRVANGAPRTSTSQRNGENWRFLSSAQSAISRRFKHRARSETFNLPCVASIGSGWLVAPNRGPFFIGATPASCELQVARSASVRGERDISPVRCERL